MVEPTNLNPRSRRSRLSELFQFGDRARTNSGSVPELGQPAESMDFFRARDVGAVQRLVHHLDRLVVGGAVDRKGRAVLAAVSERIARRVAEAGLRAIDELRGERERAQRLRADAGRG